MPNIVETSGESFRVKRQHGPCRGQSIPKPCRLRGHWVPVASACVIARVGGQPFILVYSLLELKSENWCVSVLSLFEAFIVHRLVGDNLSCIVKSCSFVELICRCHRNHCHRKCPVTVGCHCSYCRCCLFCCFQLSLPPCNHSRRL